MPPHLSVTKSLTCGPLATRKRLQGKELSHISTRERPALTCGKKVRSFTRRKSWSTTESGRCRPLFDDGGHDRVEQQPLARVVVVAGLREQRGAVADHDQVQTRHNQDVLVAGAGGPEGVARQPCEAAA